MTRQKPAAPITALVNQPAAHLEIIAVVPVRSTFRVFGHNDCMKPRSGTLFEQLCLFDISAQLMDRAAKAEASLLRKFRLDFPWSIIRLVADRFSDLGLPLCDQLGYSFVVLRADRFAKPAPRRTGARRRARRQLPSAPSGRRSSAFRGWAALVAWQTLNIAWILLLHRGVTC